MFTANDCRFVDGRWYNHDPKLTIAEYWEFFIEPDIRRTAVCGFSSLVVWKTKCPERLAFELTLENLAKFSRDNNLGFTLRYSTENDYISNWRPGEIVLEW